MMMWDKPVGRYVKDHGPETDVKVNAVWFTTAPG